MEKTIVLIHGRGFHPSEKDTRDLWMTALRHGIERDHPHKAAAFDAAAKRMAYFGDVSNAFLAATPKHPAPVGGDDQRQTLSDLQRFGRSDFNRKSYRRLPGRDIWKRELADTFAGVLYRVGLSENVISSLAPDMAHYWNADSAFGSDVRFPLIDPLKEAMLRGPVLVISHSLGSMIAYDTLWKFTHQGEYRPQCCHKSIDRWITLGSPLADPTVRANLKGARVSGPRKYPHNVTEWVNISARDDFVAYRPRVSRDYREMLSLKLTQQITDVQIENLAVNQGRSDPHHALGYLIHPATAQAVADWL
ncbi:MAG: hypothetical protein KF861_07025 [Planctomycetaceae bacterium]|nr:hypothetical protein [Planctomycetaceae bacterium]